MDPRASLSTKLESRRHDAPLARADEHGLVPDEPHPLQFVEVFLGGLSADCKSISHPLSAGGLAAKDAKVTHDAQDVPLPGGEGGVLAGAPGARQGRWRPGNGHQRELAVGATGQGSSP